MVTDAGQRGAALRFGDRRVQALVAVLWLMNLQFEGFRNRQLRPLLVQLAMDDFIRYEAA